MYCLPSHMPKCSVFLHHAGMWTKDLKSRTNLQQTQLTKVPLAENPAETDWHALSLACH